MENFSNKKYQELVSCLKEDFAILDFKLQNVLKEDTTRLDSYFESFLLTNSKRIRSAVVFLLTKAIFGKIDEEVYSSAIAVELLHNASLIHDDVIDCAKVRRNKPALNAVFTDKLAVIAGDFLFSAAFKFLVEKNSAQTVLSYIETFKKLCKGEIEQYFENKKIPTLDQYIQKSKNKTASLFCIGVENAFRDKIEEQKLNNLIDFAENFGIAFQINNDLKNILNGAEDFYAGIYTAPIVFASEMDKNIVTSKNILKELEKTTALDKTKELATDYIKRAVDNLSCVTDNEYKSTLVELCNYIGEIH